MGGWNIRSTHLSLSPVHTRVIPLQRKRIKNRHHSAPRVDIADVSLRVQSWRGRRGGSRWCSPLGRRRREREGAASESEVPDEILEASL